MAIKMRCNIIFVPVLLVIILFFSSQIPILLKIINQKNLSTSVGTSKQTMSPVLGSLEICCSQGSDWGSEIGNECSSFPVPVTGIIPEMQQLCIAAKEICCIKRRREQQCNIGKSAALQGIECNSDDSEKERNGTITYKDCCLACTLGITMASMAQSCDGIAESFGVPWEKPFLECCIEYLNPFGLEDTTPDPETTTPDPETTTPKVEVECPSGFVYNKLMHVCDDEDECESSKDDCLDFEVCVNTVGSFICELELGSGQDECDEGYEFFLTSCIDINECQGENPCKDDKICINTDGSYECQTPNKFKENNSCPIGLKLVDGKCEDINECSTRVHDCLPSQRCDNTIGSFMCVRHTTCGTGYTLNFGSGQCEDDDECSTGQHNCHNLGPSYFCRNIQGSFRCEKKKCDFGEILNEHGQCAKISCGGGFEIGPFGNCMDIDECASPNTCPRGEQCINNMGSYECLSNCEIGLKLNSVLNICEDVDECTLGTAQCFHGAKCLNTIGSYRCSCGPGYKEVNGVCKDINECLLNGRFLCGIDSECQNSEGSYRCICKQGFKNLGRRCKDIDECTEIPNICGHGCDNIYGSYRCRCRPGYKLGSDMRTCVDVDECQENRCTGLCVNEPGSYSCQCPSGYRLSSNKQSCVDIDECKEESPCRGSGQYCHNTRGGYKCVDVSCPPGYKKESGQSNRCKRISNRCRSTDISCLKKPVSLSFNFMSLIANLPVAVSGTDLFTMQSAKYDQISAKFSLQLVDVKAGPGVVQASRSSFALRTGVHQANLSLKHSLQGPQEIELELLMEMYHRNRFAGAALARVYIFVGSYQY